MEIKKSLTRKVILDAAFECFAQYGYLKTTILDITKRANISRALIYTYFKNKQDLFMTMTSEKHDYYTRQSAEVLKSGLSEKEKLGKIIDIWIIDPYRTICQTPHPHAWLDQLKSVAQSETKFRELFIDSLIPLLNKDVAEIVVLSFRGLLDDRPSLKVLKMRTATLVNVLVKSESSEIK
jgi:AcrR family transcriptional regulator